MIKVITGLAPEKFTPEKIENQLGAFTVLVLDDFRVEHVELIEFLLKDKSIFLNIICSGYGGTVFEPTKPKYEEVCKTVKTILCRGFPATQIILTLSPVIRNQKGFLKAEEVLSTFSESGLYKVRLSKLFQDNVQKRKMLQKFGTTIKEDTTAYRFELLCEKFNEFMFYTCSSEEVRCFSCIPSKLSPCLQGCRGTACINKQDNVIPAEIINLGEMEDDLMYRR